MREENERTENRESERSDEAGKVATLTSLLDEFMWPKGRLRVSMNQLALPKSRGGLNLLIPKLKLSSLITNRYLKEQHCMLFTSSIKLKTENPPDIQLIPKNYPCLETLTIECTYLTERMLDNPAGGKYIKQ